MSVEGLGVYGIPDAIVDEFGSDQLFGTESGSNAVLENRYRTK